MKADRPSSTARLVALGTAVVGEDDRGASLATPDAVAIGRRLIGPLLRCLIRQRWFRAAVWTLEGATLPGILLHYVLRKRCLERVARAALEEGIRQVVVLGAGHDALGLRLAREYPAARFWEVDHPATQSLKARVLQPDGTPANLMLIPADLSRTGLSVVLPKCPGYEPDAPALFVAEGLLMYLSGSEVRRLLAELRKCAAPARFAFTFMELQTGGRIAFRRQSRLIDLWLRLRSEPFRWGIRFDDLHRLLEHAGFRLLKVVRSEELGEAQRAAQGEHLCLAEACPRTMTSGGPSPPG